MSNWHHERLNAFKKFEQISKATGRFRYVIFDSNGEEFGKADTFRSALNQVEECWGEAWLNGAPVLLHRQRVMARREA